MYDALEFHNFAFRRFSFDKFHYTDNRRGSPMNYLAYMLKGSAKIVSKQTTVEVKQDDAFFIPIHLQYESYWYEEDNCEFLSFGFLTVEADEKLNYQLQIIHCDEPLKKRIREIPTEGFSVSCKTLSAFYAVLAEVLPYLKPAVTFSKKEELLKQAKKYISRNPDFTVPELAKRLYISEPYLYLLFKENSGGSPHRYGLKVKCQKGINLLLTTDKTVEEISDLAGFSSASHFRRILKAQTGLVPKDIRKRIDF